MRKAFADWQSQSREWSELLKEGEVAQELHDMASGVRPAVEQALQVLEHHDAEAGRDARRLLEGVHERAALRLEPWELKRAPEVWEALNEGYLGGQRFSGAAGFQTLMRYFAVYENTPRWLPRTVRRRAVPLLRIIDVVRLLNNVDIERRALIATLWVRVAVVVIAPLTASASLTMLVPVASGASAVATAAYAVVVAAATLMALLGPRIATYTMQRPTRWWLYASEQSLTIAAVIVAPCWAIAVYGAGAVNWLERPDWRLRRLFAWMALTYVPFAVAAVAQGAAAGPLAGEAAIAIAVTAIMAGSYGLMMPITVATLVRALADSAAWRIRVWSTLRIERRELRDVITAVEAGLREHAADSAEAAEAAERARVARELLAARRVTLRRRPRRLDRLLEASVARVVVPVDAILPGGVPEPRLRAARLVVQPQALARLTVESGGNARRLDALVKRIVQEAVDKGARGLIHTYVRRAPGDAVEIEIANAMPAQPISGFGTGAQWLERARIAIPDAKIVQRDPWTSDHPELHGDVYSVVVRLGPTIFERGA